MATLQTPSTQPRPTRHWYRVQGPLAPGLGWFSIGLGTAQLAAPAALAHAIGVRERPVLWRFLGLRELGAGVAILSQPSASRWLWARVAGDLLDLGLLGLAMRTHRRERGRIALAATAVVAVTVLDVIAGRAHGTKRRLAADEARARAGLRPGPTLAINRSPEDCYRLFRDLGNLPRIFSPISTVQAVGEGRSRWSAQVGRKQLTWGAELVDDRPGEALRWRAAGGSGRGLTVGVSFAPGPGGRGTLVNLEVGGESSRRVRKLAGRAPLLEALRRFKMLAEVGEVATTRGQPQGKRSLKGRALLKGPLT